MKKLWTIAISAILALPLLALAQDPAQQNDTKQSNDRMGQGDTMKQGHSGKSSVKGTVSDDGKTLTGDDGKTWTIANPDAVKGHEGHHVELKGSADATAGQIQVTSVKMLKGGAKSSMPKDSTQPPQ
jgi:hypothetical protein